jgi:oxygen-independent coproporphyrinogen-3 oxidase
LRALYVHIPFCRVLCGYCDFFSVPHQQDQVEPFIAALLQDLERLRAAQPEPIETIFVGGGTPTTLTPAQLERVLTACRAFAGPDGLREFTVEANPATVTPEKAAALRANGVDRVSLGAQSFDPRELTVLDRDHDPDDVPRTIATLQAAGLSRFSLDLIFGVPGQSLTAWERNLDRALALGPEHLSCYALTYEPNTRLHAQRTAGKVTPVENDVEADMYEATIQQLSAAGFQHYEISNFARPGRTCAHNLVYWHNEGYLGAGPSAAGYVDNVRYRNVAHLQRYMQSITDGARPWAESEQPSVREQMRDTVMLGLRLLEGLDRAAFSRRFGVEFADVFAEPLKTNGEQGLLAISSQRVRLTHAGLMVADRVIADFLD